MATWELKNPAPCLPVSVDDAKNNLRIEKGNTEENDFIEALILSASSDAENKTGRVLVDSEWVWYPDALIEGEETDFPVVPVTSITVYDEDLPSVDPDGSTGGGSTNDPPFNLVDSTKYKVVYPSLAPQGRPLLGHIMPLGGFPANARIEMKVGYPVTEIESPIIPEDNPAFVAASTWYTEGDATAPTNATLNLVFSRIIKGTVDISNFIVNDAVKTVDPSTLVETIVETPLTILAARVDAEKGIVVLDFAAGTLVAGQALNMSFKEGFLEDNFGNFVGIIEKTDLPVVAFDVTPVYPDPDPVQVEYISNSPGPIKKWIEVRVSTLYQQRSEIALRAGKSNDAMFPDPFVNTLLNPYILRSMH